MTDWDQFKRKCREGMNNDLQYKVQFSCGRLDVTVDGTGYGRSKIEVEDDYMDTSRSYRVDNSLDEVIEAEKEVEKKVELAKDLESTEEVNGWVQAEGEPKTYLKFTNMTKSIEIRLNRSGVWTVKNVQKRSIRRAKYTLVEELLTRNPLSEVINKHVRETLEEFLKNVDGIGQSISRSMARKAVSRADGTIESMDDVKFMRPRNAKYSVTGDAKMYFDSLQFDPVERAVQEKKQELVQEEGEVGIVAEAI